MRISDWSSDVCSSDLSTPSGGRPGRLSPRLHMRLETPGTRGWFRPPHLGQAHGAFKPCTAHFAAWPVPFRNADPLTLFNQHERATELRRRRPMEEIGRAHV